MRLRVLPSRVGLYFVLGLCLFPATGYRGVRAKLAARLDVPCPDLKALRDLRRRIGAAPLKALFELLAGPVAWPRTPGVMSGRYRTVAFDGCRSLKVPDTGRNRGWLGKMNAALGETGYPVIQLMTLCETGTRALIGAVFGSPADGEITWARKLLHLLDETMLVLMDRGFDAGEFLAGVAATKAQFLVRLTATRRPPVLSILAMLRIAGIYSGLLLPQAAKKYALAAGFAALQADDTRVRDLAPPALFLAASCDYQAGAWLSSLNLARVAVLLQGNFAADPWNLNKHPALAATIAQAAVIKAASRLRPEVAALAGRLLAEMGLTGEVDEILSAEHSFGTWDEKEFLAHSAEELAGVPFCDIAPERVFSFRCLGQQWRFRCRNDRAAVTATEELCATAQIVLAELAADDPMLLSSVIEVEVKLADTAAAPADLVQPLPDNECARWKVVLPASRTDAPGEADLELLGTLVIMLHRSSMLPWDKFAAALDRAGQIGLMNRIAVVTDHRTAAAYFADTGKARLEYSRGAPLADPAEFPAREAAELAPPRKAGPGYSREKALEAIRARYERSAAVTRHTLPRVMAVPATRALFRQLVEEGRPEWIVLMALANTVMNHRMRERGRPLASVLNEQWKAQAVREVQREEEPRDPSPSPAEISNVLLLQLSLVAATVAQFWGLQINQETPDLDAIESLLKAR